MAKVRSAGFRVQGSGSDTARLRDPEPRTLNPAPLWLWPLLGALVLAPLRAGTVVERVPVAAVNGLVAVALLLWAWRPGLREGMEAGREAAGVASPTSRSLWLSPTPWLGIFLLLNLLSLGVSIYRHATLTAVLDLAALFSAYWLVTQGGRGVVKWVVGTLLAGGLAAAGLALQEYGQRAWGANDPGWRAFGPFFNPNLLAATAILLAPVAFSLMLRAARPAGMAAAGAATLVLLAALLVSGSRGGALGLAVGGVMFLLLAAARHPRLEWSHALAVVGLVAVLLPVAWVLRVPFLGRVADVPGTPALAPESPAAGAAQRSNAFRVLTWKATLKMAADNPLLGTGAGTFEVALPAYSLVGYTQRAHQSYLQIAAETGVPALIAWLIALGIILARLLWSHPAGRDWLLAGIGGGLVATMAHNVVDYSWSVTGTALTFWALLGVAVVLTRPDDKDQHGDTETWRGRNERTGKRGDGGAHPSGHHPIRSSGHQVIRSSAALAGLLLLLLNALWLRAAEAQARGRLAAAAGDPRAAVEAYRGAAALTPLDAGLQIDLARVLEVTGDTEAAAAALERAARLAPTWGRPPYTLGRLLERQGRLKEAEAAYANAAKLDPRNTQPLERLAAVREAQGNSPGALEAWGRIVALAEEPNSKFYALDGMTDPIPGLAYEAVGREDEEEGRAEPAIRRYRAGADRLREWRLQRPDRIAMRQARGEGPSEREPEFQEAEARLWERLAALYARTGQPDEAADARREATAARAAVAEIRGTA